MADQQTRTINTGKTSEDIFVNSITKRGCVVFRLRDKKDLHGLNKRSVAAFGQPSDYIIIGKTGAFLAEVKSSHNPTSFPLDCFTRAQKSAMAMCVANRVGMYYRVFVHNMNEDKWYMLTANDFISTINGNRKSIKWEDLKPPSHSI